MISFKMPAAAHLILIISGAMWASTLAGFAFLTIYEFKPGSHAPSPLRWPTTSRLAHAPNKCTAVVFLHPQCPCSIATVTELSKVMARCGERLHVNVLIWQPGNSPSLDARNKFSHSALISYAEGIPGAHVTADPGGAEAKLFAAQTSGYVELFSPSGSLIFSGGITTSRGHEGDNAGADAMIAAVTETRRETVTSTPVFGCSLIERPN